jgi:serine/threonine-protein kinase
VHSGLELRDALIGTVIQGSSGQRYHLRDLLGEGGQGWVYRANFDDPDGFLVVAKVLRPECVHGEAIQRFEREADVLRRLGAVPAPNPNIVRFYDYGLRPTETPYGPIELPFIVLEHVDGQTLADVIKAHGGFGLPIARVRRMMKQVARALHTVHEQRIVHRDLKPSNILLTQQNGQEVAKVTDFGLVKLPDLTVNKTISVAGASLGYAPPEQYEMGNNRVTAQTDVFAFTSVLYEALCGTEAFPQYPGETLLRVVARMLTGERPALARVAATVPRELRDRPDLTAALDREIARALSPDPGVRHATIRELWEHIEPLLIEAGQRGVAVFQGSPAPGPALGVIDETSHEGPIVPAAVVAAPMPEWRVASRPMTGERLRAGVIAADRHSIIAVGAHGLYYYARGVWSAMQLPSNVDARFIRGAIRSPYGELVLFGDNGFAMAVSRSGLAEAFPIEDRDLTLLGAYADDRGLIFVGERISRPVGALVELPRGGVATTRSIEGCPRLHAAARLTRPADPGASGTLLVSGTQGGLFLIDERGERAITWGRTGHLYAIAPTADGGAFAVGSGGHALRISPPTTLPGLPNLPTATLEAVQTTRDLSAVVLDDDGSAWAVGGQARLLHRRASVWMRIPLDATIQGQLVAVRARRDGITVLGEDGLVLEGPGTGEPDRSSVGPALRPSRPLG